MELRILISKYNKALKNCKMLKQSGEEYVESYRLIKRRKDELAKLIVTKAEEVILKDREVCQGLGLSRKSLYGKVALANILISIDFSRGFRKILCYSGLYKPNHGRYSHRIRHSVSTESCDKLLQET
ncbi:MAG: hypothetical protein QW756_00620 [Nitrososphaerota archaeon]